MNNKNEYKWILRNIWIFKIQEIPIEHIKEKYKRKV